MKFALAILLALTVRAQDVPKDVLELLRTTADALAQKDADEFLSHFDRRMPSYGMLESEVRSLVDRSEVSSTIEIVTSAGDDRKQTLELDWYLHVDQDAPKRQIVKATVERQGRKWKFTAFDPVSFLQ